MSGGVYGGDDVCGLVFDIGSHSFRVGHAGEEYPKLDIPSFAGVRRTDTKKEADSSVHNQRDFLIGTPKLHFPRENTEIQPLLKDGLIDDWELFEQFLDHSYSRHGLSVDPKYHPVLFSEPFWNEKGRRERLCELMFEKYDVPAFYVAKSAVLTCFANGKQSGLVLDAGASCTSATPVYDGYVITQASTRSPIGGDMLADQVRHMLGEQSIDLVPSYRVAAKEEVNENEPARWTPKSNLPSVTKSFDDYMCKQVLEDLCSSVLQLCDAPIDPEMAEKLPSAPFQFPNGFSKEFMADRIRVPECLFDLNYLKGGVPRDSLLSVSQVVHTACGMTDVDYRSNMYSNVVVTGGLSLLMGFNERLQYELQHKSPHGMRVRVQSLLTPSERRFGPWIGGSILASLGMFQSMWISRAEYDESGKDIVDKRCP